MATPKPGEIRCPTCHRSTPPAAYCTQCGSAIPSDARARPRGMDRDELQDRIRARRSGADPYRRGSVPGDDGGYERFEPTPDDEGARRARRGGDRRVDRFDELPLPASAAAAAAQAGTAEGARDGAPPDLTREPDDWTAPVHAGTPAPVDRSAPPSDPVWPVRDTTGLGAPDAPGRAQRDEDEVPYPADAYADAPYDGTDDPYGYEYDTWEEPERRGSGAGAFAILGFLALGVLALLGGAVLAGVFSGDDGVAFASPSASVVASVTPVESTAPSSAASAAPSGDPVTSGGATPSGEPVVFPDGFVAQAQPCLPGTVGLQGCDSNGAVNNGQVEIWVGFQDGSPEDVLGVELIGPEGNTVGEVSIDLVRVQCQRPCDGYTYFNFSNLATGSYRVEVSRNGEFASRTSFEVS